MVKGHIPPLCIYGLSSSSNDLLERRLMDCVIKHLRRRSDVREMVNMIKMTFAKENSEASPSVAPQQRTALRKPKLSDSTCRNSTTSIT